MHLGEKKTVTIPPEEAYGAVRDELIVEVPNEELPDDMELEAGMKLQMTDPEGNDIPAVISEILETGIRIDVNHPLAGKTLIFDLQVAIPK